MAVAALESLNFHAEACSGLRLETHLINSNSLRAGCLQDCSSMDVDGVGPSSALQKFPFAKLRSRLWEARGCLTE